MSADVKRATRKLLDEICTSVGMTPEEYEIMKRWYYQSSQCWAGFWDDQLACVYGVMSATLLSEEAYLWLVTNDIVKEHPFTFVRHSQMVVESLLKSFKVIHGHVHARQVNSIQWLEWLGVKLRRSEIKNDLIPFELKRSA